MKQGTLETIKTSYPSDKTLVKGELGYEPLKEGCFDCFKAIAYPILNPYIIRYHITITFFLG